MKVIEKDKLNDNTKYRLYEIAFEVVLNNLILSVGNDNVDLFLEHFCKMFKIDFTSMSILKSMYLARIKPTKREIALFAMFTGTPLIDLTIDYRTLRKYRKEWTLNGYPNLQPLIINEYLRPVIKTFVDSYIKLMHDNLKFIKNLERLNNEN